MLQEEEREGEREGEGGGGGGNYSMHVSQQLLPMLSVSLFMCA